MKQFKLLLSLSLALCAALVSPANAQENSTKLFSGTGTATSATLSTYIVPIGNGVPRVQYVNATADNATNRLFYLFATNAIVVTTATNATQAIVYAPGVTATPRVVIYRRSAGTYEYGLVSSVAASYITLTANTAATSVGDIIFPCTMGGNIPVGNATKEINAAGGGIINGNRSGRPVILELYGASAAAINAVSGDFQN